MGAFDFLKGLFGEREGVRQQDVLSSFKEKFPAYKDYDDSLIAERLAKKHPDKYPFFAEGYRPSRTINPEAVPKEFRSEDFYNRNSTIRIRDAMDEVESYKKEFPVYANVEPRKLATALERKFPDKYKGLSQRLEPDPKPKPELKGPEEGVFNRVVDATTNFLFKRPGESAPVVREWLADHGARRRLYS